MKTMKTKRAAKHTALILGAVIILMLGITACGGGNSPGDTEDPDIVIGGGASWAHFYHNIRELDASSDFIGLVEIIGVLRYEGILPYGTEAETEGTYVIPLTVYSARVLDGVVSDSDMIEILMTGKPGEFMFASDPLMSAGEQWFIFARANDRGSYTILGGPQGRFTYDEADGTISSLSYSWYSPSELEERKRIDKEHGIEMVGLNLSEVRAEIAELRRR